MGKLTFEATFALTPAGYSTFQILTKGLSVPVSQHCNVDRMIDRNNLEAGMAF